MRVILIGAGISNALISTLLRRQFGPELKLVVFDKSRSIGGRMTTSYDDDTNPHCSLDIGAQYLTWTKSNETTNKFFQQLIDDRIIEPLVKQNIIGMRENPDKINYVAPNGISSVVQYYFDQADVDMNLSQHITDVNLNTTNNTFEISTAQEKLDEAKTIIFTIPVPQLLTELKGSIAHLIENNKDVKIKLTQVKFSSRFSLGLFYPSAITTLNVPWRMYYVDKAENDSFRFLVVDNAKRNRNEPPFSLVAHTHAEFDEKHMNTDKVLIGEQLKKNLFEFLPQLPHNFNNIKYHKWKYSQVVQPYTDKPGSIILHEQPLLVLAGDSFATESTFEACIEAAITTVKRISTLIK